MTTDWEARGRTLGESLSAFHALVVCGMDPDATATVAIALARVQADRRRVAVGDLFGDVAAIRSLVEDDDVHGIVDSFVYGVSLTRIARRSGEVGELFVLPTGSDTPDYETLFPDPRWGRLAAGFRVTAGLLVLVAPADAPRLLELVSQMDGAVIVGDHVPTQLPVAQVVTILRGDSPPAPAQVEAPAKAHAAGPVRPPDATQEPQRRAADRQPAAADPVRERLALSLAGAAGVGVIVAVALLFLWLAVAHPHWWRPSAAPLATDSVADRGFVSPPVSDSSAGRDSTADSTSDSTAAAAPLQLVDPEDSAKASAYAVELVTANTEAGAILKFETEATLLHAATISPEMVGGSVVFTVMCGAFTSRAGADSLLKELRSHKVLEATSGVVVRAPYAFRIDSGVVAAGVPGLLAELAQRDLAAYALRQADGTAWVLIGAFESPDQAALYEASLRAAGVVPQLVYRNGRMF